MHGGSDSITVYNNTLAVYRSHLLRVSLNCSCQVACEACLDEGVSRTGDSNVGTRGPSFPMSSLSTLVLEEGRTNI